MSNKSWFRRGGEKKYPVAWLWNDTYEDGVLIVWDVNEKEMLHAFVNAFPQHQSHQKKLEKNMDLHEGKFFSYDGCSMIAFRAKRPTAGHIAHEAIHYAVHLLTDRGMRFSDDSEEAYTYFIQWVVNNIHSLIAKNKFYLDA